MLQAHSFLWNYLWLAPNVLCLILAAVIYRRRQHKEFPFFFAYLLFVALKEFCLYFLDVSPRVSAETWWYAFWAGTISEGLFKFVVVAELLHHLLHSWPSVATLGRNLVSGIGALLVLLAAVAAAFAAPDNTPRYIGGAHILSQTLYLTEAGVIISIFVFAAVFKIPWERLSFGIALAFGVVWCEHLAIWALVTGGVVRNRGWEDLANGATYHMAVLVWFYYFLVPHKEVAKSAIPLPENDLAVWNRELERLVQQ